MHLRKETSLDFYSIRENVAPIYHVVACRADGWVRGLVLRLTVWLKLVREYAALLIVGIFFRLIAAARARRSFWYDY